MSTKKKFLIVIAIYVVAIICLFLGTNHYINKKDERLRRQATELFDDFFRNQNKFVDTRFANERVVYSIVSVPEQFRPSDSCERDLAHTDIFRWFELRDGDIDWMIGWTLSVMERESPGGRFGAVRRIVLYEIYPTHVAWRGRESSWWSPHPAIEVSVRNAYHFWTTNQRSDLARYYQRGSRRRVDELIRDVPNEYYTWRRSNCNFGSVTRTMFTDFYQVFAEETRPSVYNLVRRCYVIYREKETILITGGVILTIILLCFIVLLLVQRSREKKKNAENKIKEQNPIYYKLKDLCNPTNFMNPYDKEKVEKANAIYEQLMKTEISDTDTLKKLRKQAIEELNLDFLIAEYLQELKSKCNPERFLSPYNAEKIRIANDLYQKLLDNENDIELLEEIEKEINEKLYLN